MNSEETQDELLGLAKIATKTGETLAKLSPSLTQNLESKQLGMLQYNLDSISPALGGISRMNNRPL